MKILFMGTPDFAKINLERLISRGYNIVGAVTQPDKPKGRGYSLVPPPVKVLAGEHGIPVYQPERLKDNEEFKKVLEELSPDLIAVVAYGRILPSYVLDFPKYGCINVHGSLLPKYRGAAPIQRSIMAGEKRVGATIMYMNEGLDTGDMLKKVDFELGENDKFGDVHDKMADMGADALCEVIDLLAAGIAVPEKQDDTQATHAAKIEKEDCRLDFSKSAEEIHNTVRGLSPVPLAFSQLNGKSMKIVSTKVIRDVPCGIESYGAGEVISLRGGIISVKCGNNDSVLGICEVVPEGKGKMGARDFINGRKVAEGDIFGAL